MVARSMLVMAGYLVVGLLLAYGSVQETRPSADLVAASAVALPGAIDSRPQEPAPVEVSVPSTTTSTVAWASARLAPVASDPDPVWLEIPSLGVSAEIAPAGIDRTSGQMEVPERADLVGWYRFGPRPGEDGSAVLAAHVDMEGFGPGVFFHLDRLANGDEVSVHFADGSVSSFEVVSTVRVAKEELDLESIFARSGDARLTLITCGGAFNHTERSYDDNVVTTLIAAGGI
jgi:LPXTG-site transpeptidase (sortase) family protein